MPPIRSTQRYKIRQRAYFIEIKILSHLKVEFPEARIYEETLNILLYENRTGPDMELMQATSTRGAVGSLQSHASDDEEDAHNRKSQSQDNQKNSHGIGRLRSTKQN